MDSEDVMQLNNCTEFEDQCTGDLSKYVATSFPATPLTLPLMNKSFPNAEYSNSFISVQPCCLVFHSYQIGRPITRFLHIINIAGKEQRFHILPLEPGPFSLQYEKKRKLLPGTELPVKITFLPESYSPHTQNVYIHCPGEQNLAIPITASPTPDLTGFPTTLHFPNTPVNSSSSLQFELTSDLYIPFAFQLQFRPATDCISVIPASGTVPPQGCTPVRVNFKPTQLRTILADLELTLPDIDSNIRICSCSGSCLPVSNQIHPKGTRVSQAQQKRRVILVKHNNLGNKSQTKPPAKSNSSGNIGLSTRNVHKEREREFLNGVHLVTEKEKMNQLRWSTTLGEAEHSPGPISRLLSEKETISLSGQSRSTIQKETVKIERPSQERSSVPDRMSQESFYQANVNWQERRESLYRFLLAAKRIVIQLRAQRRLECIRTFLKKAQAEGLSPCDYENRVENSVKPEDEIIFPEVKEPRFPFIFFREGSVKVGIDFDDFPCIDLPELTIDYVHEEPFLETIAPIHHEQQMYPDVPLFCPDSAYVQPPFGKGKRYGAFHEYEGITTLTDEERKIVEEHRKITDTVLAAQEHHEDVIEPALDNVSDSNPENEPFNPLDIIPVAFDKISLPSVSTESEKSGREAVLKKLEQREKTEVTP